ncbi:hypothetical protein CW745_16405 [Psychromonas sp. psych-6C06]|uniref:hypothetical protein n=1 Tax=Psychromonas sp. psych-6C06 TaxID=2058089 RepID=UPI000C33EFD0|nr:hypothetical protein [Psychromonas sp. psych-6C06]PKF60175.1 hypothetical protein CW745_16405 [Psychromonas sp. psych-6C06]
MTEFDSHELYGKTLKEAGELLDKYVIPVFRRGRFERPEMEGTGFLIEQYSNIYFITASHVIDAIKATQSNFVIAIETQMFSLSLANCKRTIETKTEIADNQFDLAAILISPENDYYELCKKVTIPSSKVLINHQFRQVDMQILQGFPSSKNKTAKCFDSQNKHFSGALWTYSFNFHMDCDVTQFNKIPGSSYPIHWSKKINGQKTLHPRGCSGGPYWFIPNKDKVHEHYLAGVFIEYYEKKSVAFVTKIDHVIDLINEFDA